MTNLAVSSPSPSGGVLRPLVRREQSERELRRVKKAVNDWFAEHRQRNDDGETPFADLHRTRLEALEGVLTGGFEALAAALASVDVAPDRDPGDVNVACRDIDQAIVLMHRVWTYYRDKFDQRDDPALEPTLTAADEVVWSCYKQVYLSGELPAGAALGPAPLAYIDSQYSPATWEAGKQPPTGLREPTDISGLEAFLETLPVPILRLPTWCVDSPWWLVFIAHEVGHNIQRELGLIEPFREVVASAWDNANPDAAARRERWRRWDVEVFADLVSVAMIGPWAILGLREILAGPADEMSRPSTAYPAAIVRLTLMARAAKAFGMDGTAALAGLDPAAATATPKAEADVADIDRVLERALGPWIDGGSTLDAICGLGSFMAGLPIEPSTWGESLGVAAAKPRRNLLTPRYVLCGSMVAWERAAALASAEDRASRLDTLAKNTMAVLATSGPDGTRVRAAGPSLGPHGSGLAAWLLDQSRKQRTREAES